MISTAAILALVAMAGPSARPQEAAQQAATLPPASYGATSPAATPSAGLPPGSNAADLPFDRIRAVLAPIPPSTGVVGLRLEGLLDDFNDGDDVGWSHHGISSVPPAWEVVNGRYRLSLGPPATMQSLEYAFARWEDSVADPDAYRHGRVRMRLRLLQPQTDVFLVVRGDTPAFGVQFWNGQALLSIGNLFHITTASVPVFASAPTAVDLGSDYLMEARFVGPELSLKFWYVRPKLPRVFAGPAGRLSGAPDSRRGGGSDPRPRATA